MIQIGLRNWSITSCRINEFETDFHFTSCIELDFSITLILLFGVIQLSFYPLFPFLFDCFLFFLTGPL